MNQIISLWTRLAHGDDVSLLLTVAAVAVAAIVDVLVRVGRARTARRLRIAAAAYAQREIAKEDTPVQNAAPRLKSPRLSVTVLRLEPGVSS